MLFSAVTACSESSAEAVNDEFYRQRMTVQERFNAEIKLEIYPDEGGGTTLEKNIHAMVTAGDELYDLVYNGDGCGRATASAGTSSTCGLYPPSILTSPGSRGPAIYSPSAADCSSRPIP